MRSLKSKNILHLLNTGSRIFWKIFKWLQSFDCR